MKTFTLIFVTFALLIGTHARSQTVVDVVINSENHTTLEAAVVAAELAETLSGDGPFTLFAPTDDAFGDLPDGTVESLLEDPIGNLKQILLYHAVGTEAYAGSLQDGMTIKTVQGQSLTVSIADNNVMINGALVSVSDIEAENGIVHVIDKVLLPDSDVKISQSEETGSFLTDREGNTLYYFTKDADGSSMCTDGCLENWPEFYTSGTFLPDGLDQDDFSTITREDGKMQTTYKGWPLYYFAGDETSGDINGEGINNVWYVANPEYTVMLTDNQLIGNDGISYKADYTEGEEMVQFLTDANGVTLYAFSKDFNNRNMFTANDFSNNEIWPIYETDEIDAPTGLDENDFTIIDVHGKNQLTYKGWPLYYFGGDDMERGNTKGVNVPAPGIWPVLTPAIETAPDYTVVDVIVNSESHTTLETAVAAAELDDDLSAEGPFTVFAPTDAAFEALPEEVLSGLLADPTGDLADILLYHVIDSKVMSGDLSDGITAQTLNGKDVTVAINDDGVFINNAKVVTADIETDNGVVHVIDAVMLPPTTTVVDVIVNSESHTTLETAVVAAELDDDLSAEGPFTVFAPTDAAFEALPEEVLSGLLADPTGDLADILLYHVIDSKVMSRDLSDGITAQTLNGKDVTVAINDDGVFINKAKVVTADIETDNGVVHVIDAVMLPPTTTVVDVIVNSESHTTLETAVVAAELDDDLSAEGPFTVFAPTDAAFEALPEEVLNDLLADPTGDLADILLYHVIDSKVMSGDLSDGITAQTLNGKDVTVAINDDGVFINNAKVVTADIETDNGVVHVIDAVMLPSTPTSVKQLNDFSVPLAYPNPTVNSLTINLKTDRSQEVQTTVYDVAGNQVAPKTTRYLTAGVNQIEKDVSTLLPGMYFIQIDNRSTKQTIKFVKR